MTPPRVLALGAVLSLVACTGAATDDDTEAGGRPAGPTAVQLLSVNDFHGRISASDVGEGLLVADAPGAGADGELGTADDGPQPVGGAAYLAATLDALRADFEGNDQDSLFLAAGDLVSASTFVSGAFLDEPAVEVLDALGLDYSSVGNHEFDRGKEELYRISAASDGRYSDDVTACEGVQRGVEGCFPDSTGEDFDGADFGYLAANVTDEATGRPALPPYAVVPTSTGARIGVIGVVTAGTPDMVRAEGIAGLVFEDPATVVNRSAAELQERGVEAIVVLTHEGGWQAEGGRYDTCAGDLAGTPMGAFNAAVSPAVDVIISAHTHVPYTCTLADPDGVPRPVTQAGVYGGTVTDLRLTLGPDGDVQRDTVTVAAVPVLRSSVAPDPDVEAIVAYWETRAEAAGDTPVGSITGDLQRAGAPDSGVGGVIADSMLAAVPADVAFINHGMIRADVAFPAGTDGRPAGTVTLRELFRVLPFQYTLEVVTLPGATIREVLEQQFLAETLSPLSASGNLTYAYDPARAPGNRVDPCSLRLAGQPVDPAGSYRVALTSYLAGGGDGFTPFAEGTGRTAGPVDLDALVEYLEANSPVDPPSPGRAVATSERGTC